MKAIVKIYRRIRGVYKLHRVCIYLEARLYERPCREKSQR